MTKFLLLFVMSASLFAQTGLMYQMPDGTIKYLKPTGGVIIDLPRGQIRSAINGGLKATTPNQLWISNLNGDGQGTFLNMQDFTKVKLPGGTTETLSVIQKLNPKAHIHTVTLEEANNRRIDLLVSNIGKFNLVYVNGLLYYDPGDYVWVSNPPNTTISLTFQREIGEGDVIQIISF